MKPNHYKSSIFGGTYLVDEKLKENSNTLKMKSDGNLNSQ